MRAWIIGNGPSLNTKDLNRLAAAQEVTFATNRVFRIFENPDPDEIHSSRPYTTHWRPDYYVRLEALGAPNAVEKDDIAHIKHHCFMYLQKGLSGFTPWRSLHPKTRVEWFFTCQHGWPFEEGHVPDWHLGHTNGLHNICNFGTSVHAALQIAVVLGFGPLYLLGCDLGYVDGGVNHFCDGYSEGYTLRPATEVNRDAYLAHEVAARCSPVPIFNATRGGDLDVYPRVTLEEVLDGNPTIHESV